MGACLSEKVKAMKHICELNDKIVLGQDGLSNKAPRLTARAIVKTNGDLYAVMYAAKFKLHCLPGGGVENGENHLTEEELESRTVVEWHTFDEVVSLINEQEFDRVQAKYLKARDVAALQEYSKWVELYIPKLEDLWFYQRMMSDPETMSYNDPWGGCIDYPDDVLPGWYAHWVGQEPERFYAYIKRSSDGAWIGDVNFHYTPEKDWWDIGIVIYAPYRGKGYSVPALKLLLDHAFRDCGVSRIHNEFEYTRSAALHVHKMAGFREVGAEDGIIQLLITKDEYLAANSQYV